MKKSLIAAALMLSCGLASAKTQSPRTERIQTASDRQTAGVVEKKPTDIEDRYKAGFLVKEGEKMPYFEIAMTDGSTVNSDQLLGKVVLIDFWATWCGSCVKELREAKESIIKRFEGQDLVMIPVASMTGGDTPEMIIKFAEDYPVPMGMDHNQVLLKMVMETESLPRKVLIGRDGTILATTRGAFKGLIEAVIARAEEALKK